MGSDQKKKYEILYNKEQVLEKNMEEMKKSLEKRIE